MRVVLFVNNRLGLEVTKQLHAFDDEIVGLVIHPAQKQKFTADIIAAAGVDPSRIYDGSRLRNPAVVEAIHDLRADIGFSILFDFILKRELFDTFPRGCINLHPSLLPYNRGQCPNVWSIVEQTPAGVTLHYVDDGLDTGDIIAQQRVTVEPTDTGLTLYRRLEEAGIELFRQWWPAIRCGNAPRIPQDHALATYHRMNDLEKIEQIDLDRMYTARELINVLRARTFPPHPGACFVEGGRRINLRLELSDSGS